MLHKQFILITALLLVRSLVYAFDNSANDNVAVYWGQDSSGSQGSLASYCQSSDADIFLLSFADGFPNLDLNFANACSDSFDDSGLLHCSSIAADMVTCQSLGKKVLLSLGGASGSYGFNDNSQAEEFAQTLWDTFGEGSGVSERPFDSAVVDGFDFDIENNNNVGYAALVNKLRELFKAGSKQYYISAAPQCPYPDASVGDLLANADVDFAFIQFYNNYCSVEGGSFNWDTWVNYAENISPNSNIKLYLGLPGSAWSAGSGYISDVDVLASTIEQISSSANFGGVSFWDASTVFSNTIDGEAYVHIVKDLLENAGSDDINDLASISTQLTTTLQPTTTTTSMELTTTSYSELDTTTTIATPSTTPVTTTLAPATTQSTVLKDVDVPTDRTAESTASTTVAVPDATTPAATTLITQTNTPTPTTMATQTTTAAAAAATSTDTAAHAIAVTMNAQYAAGQYNGKDTCTDGELACAADGSFAMCNFGSWVSMPCAAGTTCFAYDYDNTVLTQCGYTDQKAQFM